MITLAVLVAIPVLANDLSVDRRSIRMGETVTITVSLEGPFATIDNTVKVPVRNLAIDGEPAVSSAFSWINGNVSRSKVLRFVARPLAPGQALVGPLVINGEGGQRDTLPPLSIEVLPDVAMTSNDPEVILRELLATGREPFFVVTQIDRPSVYAGEEVVVTWMLYNAASVQRWQISQLPKLRDFWSEELDVRNEEPDIVRVAGHEMQRLAVRRVALFPLRSGTLTIDSIQLHAEILRRIETFPFSPFEGNLVDVMVPSASMTVDARPLPPGTAADVVGRLVFLCQTSPQKNGGPITVKATLRGRANLRSAPAPQFKGPVDGEVTVEPLPLQVERTHDGATMTRSWNYVIFPARTGRLAVPPLRVRAFAPDRGAIDELECGGGSVAVTASQAPEVVAAPLRSARGAARGVWPWVAVLGGLIAVLLIALPHVRRALRVRREVRALTTETQTVRERVQQWLKAQNIDESSLARELSDRGDAYRALQSFLAAADRDEFEPGELRERVRDLVAASSG